MTGRTIVIALLMTVQIKAAPLEQKPILQRLMQLYQYDFSEIEGNDVNQNGLFEYKYLDLYWTESGRFPFLIYVDDKIAGFVLVNSHSYLHKRTKREIKVIAEFFVMRKFRRQGIGKMVAFQIFDKFPGKWEVQQTNKNVVAQQFWRRIISEYMGGNFSETILDNKLWRGPIQSFDTSNKIPPNSK